jgi:hypothetical protein
VISTISTVGWSRPPDRGAALRFIDVAVEFLIVSSTRCASRCRQNIRPPGFLLRLHASTSQRFVKIVAQHVALPTRSPYVHAFAAKFGYGFATEPRSMHENRQRVDAAALDFSAGQSLDVRG